RESEAGILPLNYSRIFSNQLFRSLNNLTSGTPKLSGCPLVEKGAFQPTLYHRAGRIDLPRPDRTAMSAINYAVSCETCPRARCLGCGTWACQKHPSGS